MKNLSLLEIISAFPEETQKQVPRHIRRINKLLKPYEDYFIQLEKQTYDNFTKWYIREAVRICYMPHEILTNLARLRKLQRMMNYKDVPGKISDTDIQRARDVRIETLIKCVRKGGKYWARCPFHTERTASFCINKDNTWHCFGGCGHGDSISFVMKSEGLNFVEAVRYLNKL